MSSIKIATQIFKVLILLLLIIMLIMLPGYQVPNLLMTHRIRRRQSKLLRPGLSSYPGRMGSSWDMAFIRSSTVRIKNSFKNKAHIAGSRFVSSLRELECVIRCTRFYQTPDRGDVLAITQAETGWYSIYRPRMDTTLG